MAFHVFYVCIFKEEEEIVYFDILFIYSISLHTIITNIVILWSHDKSKEKNNKNIKSFNWWHSRKFVSNGEQTAANKGTKTP
jgi:hypothetical protein